jgi:ABC-type dipeptide/oligopeptide/nickel transport system permease component
MLRYLAGRLLSLGLSLALASLAVFVLVEVLPGDAAAIRLGLNADPAAVAALRAEMGLDRPAPLRYLAWAGGMLRGDLGTSYTYKAPVAGMVADRLWVSLPLALYALVLSTLVAIPVGVLAAARRGRATDVAVMGATQLGVAVPNFWFAMILSSSSPSGSGWFSAGGLPGLGERPPPRAQGADPARRRARAAAGGDPRAGHAVVADRHAGRGLHPHREGQGPDPLAGPVAARVPQRADPGADDPRACSSRS